MSKPYPKVSAKCLHHWQTKLGDFLGNCTVKAVSKGTKVKIAQINSYDTYITTKETYHLILTSIFIFYKEGIGLNINTFTNCFL